MAAYWKIAVHSAYNMFSYYGCLIVNLVVFSLQFSEWEFLSDCAFSLSLPACTVLQTAFYLHTKCEMCLNT